MKVYRKVITLLSSITAMWCSGIAGATVTVPAWVPDGVLNPPIQEPWLCQGRYLKPDEGGRILEAFLASHPDRAGWESFATGARQHILEGAGLVPMPERTPLEPVLSEPRIHDGYSVQNVRFQSISGYWVTGNLYRPVGIPGPHAGILHTHGHSSSPEGEGGLIRHGRFKEDVQMRAAGLARMGAVCLTIDMVGYGDSYQVLVEDVHHSDMALTLQLWNAIRALDFLESLDGVDPARLGVTGHSGGGTQAFLLTAVDARVAVSVPVAMVSSWFFGGCDCESGRPIHASDNFFMNNAMIAALAAPRPMLTVSNGGDWTSHTPELEFPFLKKVYQYYGAADRVANVHLPEEGHNYGLSKRLAMYPFMARYLNLDLTRLQNGSGQVDESVLDVEDPLLMRCFPDSASVPEGALRSLDDIRLAWDRLMARSVYLSSESQSSLYAYELRTDGMTEPEGVDSGAPRFSWKLEGSRNGARQTAYQLQVAAAGQGFDLPEKLLWDSGSIQSAEQLNLRYGGPALASSREYSWRVRVWDEDGRASDWSKPVRFSTGILKQDDWRASWIAHPDWLEFNRPHLGYRSNSEDDVEVEKWIQIDLGRQVRVDQVVLNALRHTVAERLGFPQWFKVELSADPEFSDPVVLADYTSEPFANQWVSKHTLAADGAQARFLKVTANRLRDTDGEICLAFSQVEIISNGTNVAPGSTVTASDSVESGLWSAAAVVDGKGIPGTNPMDNRTAVMRKDFAVGGPLRSARLHVSGVGQYVLYLNGRRVGRDKLSPGWTDARKTVLYDTFDVLDGLEEGANALGIALAGGMYSVPQPDGRYTKFIGRFRPLEAILQLRLEYLDGRIEFITTDSSWKSTFGPTTYSHVYGGEDYDATLLPGTWLNPGFDDSEWVSAAEVEGPGGSLRGSSHSAPPVRTMGFLDPVSITRQEDGSYIYDLGQNASLMPRIQVSGPAGSRVRIVPSELLDEDGSLRTGSSGRGDRWWQYTLAGGDRPEFWEAEFFYQGARYLQVIPEPASEGGELPRVLSLRGLVTHASARAAGRFESSSELFNQARTLVRWAQRSNMVSVLTDCPHRERLGWLEQYHLNGPSLRYEFDLDRLFRKTFQDMVDAQVDFGLVPNIAPEFIVFNGAFRESPEWGSAIIISAWQQYLFSGDKAVLEEFYPQMKGYLLYLMYESSAGRLDDGLGDWYDLGPGHPGYSQLTPIGLTALATLYQDAVSMMKIAGILGDAGDVFVFQKIAEIAWYEFNQKYLDAETGFYGTGSQTSNAMPYFLQMVPRGLQDKVLDHIISDIRDHGNGFTSGDVGHRYLLQALATGLRSDVIYDMHHQSDRPGYGYQLKMGATSLTEAWDANPRSSQNHFMLGHITEWFYKDLVGIAPTAESPGFGLVEIRPQPVGDISWASGSFDSVRGPVEVSWDRSDGTFRMEVSIPANTTARIHIPSPDPGSVTVNGIPLAEATFAEFQYQKNNYTTFRVPSGSYSIAVE